MRGCSLSAIIHMRNFGYPGTLSAMPPIRSVLADNGPRSAQLSVIPPLRHNRQQRLYDISLATPALRALKIYLKQITEHKAIPFPLVTKNGMTAEEEETILKASQSARLGKMSTRAMPTDEAI